MSSGATLLPCETSSPIHCATIARNHVWNQSVHRALSLGTQSAKALIWSFPSHRPCSPLRKSSTGLKALTKLDSVYRRISLSHASIPSRRALIAIVLRIRSSAGTKGSLLPAFRISVHPKAVLYLISYFRSR